MILNARSFAFTFPRPALVMGIVNVTPDSFSDGGKFFTHDSAVEHALTLIKEGADIVDIGGESTRPDAIPVNEQEELRRILPVVEALAARVTIPISVDTMKPAVARAALEAGASIINDVGANRADDSMWKVISDFRAAYVIMHMQGTPQTMQRDPVYADVVLDIMEFFEERLRRLDAFGITREQLVFDVGLGFGKTLEHNLQLLASIESFTRLNRPLLLGASRKSFIARAASPNFDENRLGGSLASACWAVERGVNIVRTHDVAATRQAIRLTELLVSRRSSASLET